MSTNIFFSFCYNKWCNNSLSYSTGKRSSIRPSTVGKSTKRKVKEPFFAGKSAQDVKSLFARGRSTTVSQKIVSEWNIERTSNIDLQYEFIEELESKKEYEDCSPTLDDILNVIKQNDPQYHFKYYFNKMSQVSFLSSKISVYFVNCPGKLFHKIISGYSIFYRYGNFLGGNYVWVTHLLEHLVLTKL